MSPSSSARSSSEGLRCDAVFCVLSALSACRMLRIACLDGNRCFTCIFALRRCRPSDVARTIDPRGPLQQRPVGDTYELAVGVVRERRAPNGAGRL